MAVEDMPGRLVALHSDAISNIAMLKQQQWAITNYVLLSYGALFATSRAVPEAPASTFVITGLTSLAGVYGLWILRGTQFGLVKFRSRLTEIYKAHYSCEERERFGLSIRSKGFWKNSEVYTGLSAVVLLGAGLVVWMLLA